MQSARMCRSAQVAPSPYPFRSQHAQNSQHSQHSTHAPPWAVQSILPTDTAGSASRPSSSHVGARDLQWPHHLLPHSEPVHEVSLHSRLRTRLPTRRPFWVGLISLRRVKVEHPRSGRDGLVVGRRGQLRDAADDLVTLLLHNRRILSAAVWADGLIGATGA